MRKKDARKKKRKIKAIVKISGILAFSMLMLQIYSNPEILALLCFWLWIILKHAINEECGYKP